MQYSAKQLPNGRWGIYSELRLLATIGCKQTCDEIILYLTNSRNRKRKRVDLLRKNASETGTAKRKQSKRLKAS